MILSRESIKGWLTGLPKVGSSIEKNVVKPFSNAEEVIRKFNLGMQHKTLTTDGFERLKKQSDDSLAVYLQHQKDNNELASKIGYETSLKGSITGFTKVNEAIKEYNILSRQSADVQKEFTKGVSISNQNLGKYFTKVGSGTASMWGYVGSLVSSKVATFALNAATLALQATMSMGMSLLASSIISTFISNVDDATTTIKEAKEAADGFSESISEFNSSIKKNKSTLSDLNDKYKELSNGVGALGQNLSLTDSEYEEYKNIISQVSEIMPDLTARYNDQGEKIGFVKEQLVDLNKEYDKYRQNQAIKFITEGDEDGNTFEDVLYDYKSRHAGHLNEYVGDEYYGGTSLPKIIGAAFKEIVTFGHADTFDDIFTAKSAKYVYETLRDATDKNDAVSKMKGIINAAVDQKEAFGYTALEIYDMTDEEFELWRETLNGYIQRYESEIASVNQRVREGIVTLAESKDDYWAESVSEDEKSGISSFLSGMTDSMIESFEDENGNIKQGDLNNFVSKLITNFSNDGEFFNAYSSLMAEEFRNMSYKEAVDAIYEWVTKVAEVTGFDQYQIMKMFGLENFGIDILETKAHIETDSAGNVVDENGNTTYVSDALQSLDYDDAKNVETIIGKLQEGEKISWANLITQLNTMKETADSIVVSLEDLISASDGISSLATAFKELTDNEYISLDTISKIKEAVGDSISNWDEYEKKLMSVKKGTDEYNQLMHDLTYATLENKLGTDGLAQTDEKYITRILEENGVLNANVVAQEMIAKAKAKAKIEEQNFRNITEDNINSLITECEQLGVTEGQVYSLMVSHIRFNSTNLDPTQKVNALKAIAKAAGVTKAEIDNIFSASNTSSWNEKKSWMEENGVTTTDDYLNRTGKTKDGKTYKYKDYIYKGVRYDTVNDVNEAIMQDKIDGKFSDIEYTTPDYSDDDNSSLQTFDWIEVKISRIQRAISNFGKTVSATWKSWGVRNDALKQQLSEITNEYNKQEEAAQKYLSLAESVTGLTPDEKAKIRDGSMDYNDEDLPSEKAEAINKYKDLYEKYLAAEDAKDDLNNDLATAARTKFDNISAEFESILSMNEHEMSMLEGYVDQVEARGHMVSTKYYSSMIDVEKKNISTLQSEYDALNNALTEAVNTGRIEKYSEEWYNMQGSINDVSKEILDANTNLIELQNTMRELDWEAFDKLQEKISYVTEESDFLIDLMSNDKMYNDDGSITEQGQATLGLHALNYNTYMSQADDYAEQLRKINAEIAEDPNNQNLLEHRQELLESQRDMILAAEDEKQAMKDLVEDGYNSFLDSMQEIIDKRKEAMQEIKDLRDYEKNIADLNKEVTILEKREIAMLGDDSEEGRLQLQQIQNSLQEARENLEETEYERYLSDQEKMLDSLYDETEQWINTRLDDIDGSIKNVIGSVNGDPDSIKATLEKETQAVGSKLSDEMSNIWSTDGAASKVVSEYGSDFSSKLTTTNDILTGIKNGIKAMLDENDIKADMDIDSSKKLNQNVPTVNPTTTPSTNQSTNSTNNSGNSSNNSGWGSWFISKAFSGNKNNLNIDTSIVDRLKWKDFDSSESVRASYYKAMGGSGTYTGSSKQNRWMLEQMKSHGFAKGGTIGSLINKSGENGFILARTGEEVLSLEKIEGMKDVFEAMNPIANMLKSMPTYTQFNGVGGNTITNDIDMNIVLEGINNADEFITAIKTDKKFEKFIQQITIGNAMGRNTLSKNRY